MIVKGSSPKPFNVCNYVTFQQKKVLYKCENLLLSVLIVLLFRSTHRYSNFFLYPLYSMLLKLYANFQHPIHVSCVWCGAIRFMEKFKPINHIILYGFRIQELRCMKKKTHLNVYTNMIFLKGNYMLIYLY